VQEVRVVIARDPQTCWRAFIDVTNLVAWVPGLARAQTITMSRGLPGEVHFEFGTHAYTLVYSYDVDAREVRWHPKIGAREGVSGFAQFQAAPDGGTLVTYGIAQGEARSPDERRLGDPQVLIDAFVGWLTARS
jgi:hypothetical protein